MQGLTMDPPLLRSRFIEHAAENHGDNEGVTRIVVLAARERMNATGTVHRLTLRQTD